MCPQDQSKTVLVVSPLGEDQLAGCLREVFRHSLFQDFNWRMQEAQTCREALECLHRSLIPVVISWCDLCDINWKDLWKRLLRQAVLLAHPPLLIVSYQPVSHCFWSEVINLGGYDVLVKPFEPWDVFRLLSLAWERWRDRAS
jgi:DNA-binding NtrC family response regulator